MRASCAASGDWSGTKATSGSESLGPLSATASYTLSCSGAGGLTSFTLPVSVLAQGTLHIVSGAPPDGKVGTLYNRGNGSTCFYINGHSGYCYPCSVGSSLRACPAGYVYQDSFAFLAAGGAPPYNWMATGLPPGLMVSPDGTFFFNNYCCRPQSAGTYDVSVTVTDSGSPAVQATATYTIVIAPPPPPMIGASPWPSIGAINLPYSTAFRVGSGGQAPFSWSYTGALPPGLAFNSDGTLSGTPTALGSFALTLMVQDALGQAASPQNVTIQILAHGFKVTGSMGAARSEHTATLLGNGKVLIAGGYSYQAGLVTATAELFDESSGSFAMTGDMGTGRHLHTATLLGDGTVLIVGGLDASGPITSVEIFNSAGKGNFAPTGSMGTARFNHTATLLKDGTVLVAGGGDATSNAIGSAEVFDPATGVFTPTTGSMMAARFGHTATLLNDGKVLLTGGTGGGPSLQTSELYDPATGTFSPAASMGTGRESHSATLLANGNVLVTGGFDGGNPLETSEVFSPGTDAFTASGSMSAQRARQTATLLSDGTVLVTGGAPSPIAELFDPAMASFAPAGSMTTTRDGHTATLLNDGKVLVTGGTDGAATALASAEVYQ